jgi:hypothetical protein
MPIFEKLTSEQVRALGLDPAPQLLDWRDLARREPRLMDLLERVQAVRDPGGAEFCANAIWFGFIGWSGYKPRIGRLVGWTAEQDDPLLRSAAAYELAYTTLYRVLPPCRNCRCG